MGLLIIFGDFGNFSDPFVGLLAFLLHYELYRFGLGLNEGFVFRG